MAKLGRKVYPTGHGPDDFECFGPPATTDGQFDNCMIADMGCFNQSMIDSNKFYHGAVVQSKKNKKWYVYFEWGRTGKSADFQFVECYDKNEACAEFAKQLHSKNDKRGEWVQIAGKTVLRAKAGEDCYLVRPAARRTTGLPDAQKVIHVDSKNPVKVATSSSSAVASPSKWDMKTLELGRALTGGTIDFTRKSFAGNYVPTQSAIDEARDILAEAMKRVKVIGDDPNAQIKDQSMQDLTSLIYGRIPKVKPIGADPSTWVLSSPNIQGWQFDLDAFEAALMALDTGGSNVSVVGDPFSGFDLEIKWMDPKTTEGEFIRSWMPKASADRHYHVGNMEILNMWALRQPGILKKFTTKLSDIAKESSGRREFPSYQPKSRPDLPKKDQDSFKDANVGLLFHGTRSVNCAGILRTGLRLPNQLVGVAITGAMFGPGLYWADDWRKSDGYTSRSGSHWSAGSGGIKGRGAFMFVGDVVLGKPHVASGYSGYTSPPKGCHSVAGLAGRSGVQNNEWIIYTAAQHSLRYLVEYRTNR